MDMATKEQSECKSRPINGDVDALFEGARESFCTYMKCVSKLQELKIMEITDEEITSQTRYMPLQSPYCDLECSLLLHKVDYPSQTEYASVLISAVLKKSLHENLHLGTLMCKSKKDGVHFCIEGQVSSEDLRILHELIELPEYHGHRK